MEGSRGEVKREALTAEQIEDVEVISLLSQLVEGRGPAPSEVQEAAR